MIVILIKEHQSPSQHGFLIADAGGGTLDISSYGIKATSPLVIEEIAPPDCIFAGSVFVSRRARKFLEEKLKNSKYGTPDALDHITKKFDESTKRLFRDKKELQFIAFGSPLDKDLSVGIRGGQLKLTGQEVANLFEPSVEAAVDAIKAQIDASKGMIRSVFLVGGYAASSWLFSQLQQRLGKYDIVVSRPDSQTQAVADGAVGFFCDHHVSARMSKFMYGVEYLREFDQANLDHVAREDRLCELPSGPRLLPDAFDCILARGVQVKESTVFTRKYSTELTSLSLLSVFEVEIWCFRGGNEIPTWIDRQSDTFSTLCIVQADLSLLSGSAEPKVSRSGKQYWTIVFSVEIHFGLTEFKARIKWVDDGNTKYGPATIIYNEHGHRAVDDDEPDMYPEDDHSVGGGTPRSERLRSLPVSRARSPTGTPQPSSPGGNDGSSMYSGDANVIRGIPPPAAMPHPHGLARERTLSKPTTPKVTSPTVPQMEREPSRQGRRDRGISSRASSVTGARIGETLSSVWDPQLRSPIPPLSPQTPTQQPPQPPTPQPPSQPRSQQHTPKPKSRKSSMSAFSHAASQPSPPPPPPPHPELATPAQSSPRPPSTPGQGQVASSKPASAQASPKPSHASPKPSHASPKPSHASPKPSILPPSRGLSRVATPHKQENPLSPLNPSAQAQPELGAEDITVAPVMETWATNEEVAAGGANDADFGAQDAGWGAEESNETWELGGDNSAGLDVVPGAFDGGGDEGAGGGEDLLGGGPTPLIDPVGGSTLLSGSISSLMSSNPVAGLSHKLSNFGFGFGSAKNADTSSVPAFSASFGLGGKKSDEIELKSGIVWGSSAAKAAAGKAGAALGAWGAPSAKTAAEKAGATLGTWGSPSAWGKKPQSAAGSKAVTPNTPGTPRIPEQMTQSAQLPPALEENSAEELGLPTEPIQATAAEGKPAEEQELTGETAQASVSEGKTVETPEQAGEAAAAINKKAAEGAHGAEEANPASTEVVPQNELAESNTASAEADPQGVLAHGDQEEMPALPVPAGETGEPSGTETKPDSEEQTVDAQVTAPPPPEDEGFEVQNKKKKGKKGRQAPTEPSSPTTPTVENALSGSSKKSKKGQKSWENENVEDAEQAGEQGNDHSWSTPSKKGKKDQKGWAATAQGLKSAADLQENENVEDTAEQAGDQWDEQAPWSTPSKKGKKGQKGLTATTWGSTDALDSQENENVQDTAQHAGEQWNEQGQGQEQSGDVESGEKHQENAEPILAAENTEGQGELGAADKLEEEGQGDDDGQAPPEGDNNEGDEGEEDNKPTTGNKKKKKKGGGAGGAGGAGKKKKK
ncbi:hypothetical protein APHAL10511_007671 [Amanita phalloides]|nr:hypothetical protein APHAL10511_007671 [Amanita phalloides]